jgi:hypothetical protein
VSAADAVGSVGVALLLLAFFLNVFGWLARDATAYQLMNLAGAALAGWASWMIGYLPFVVLEATWAAVALAALVRTQRRGRNSRPVT